MRNRHNGGGDQDKRAKVRLALLSLFYSAVVVACLIGLIRCSK